MKAAALLVVALCVAAPSMGLQMRKPSVPAFPSYTMEKWAQVLSDLEFKEEVCDGCKPGTEPQSPLAGFAMDVIPDIINGKKATAGQFPHQVGIYMDQSYFCGGSVISEYWVLTAGHCVEGIRKFSIAFGSLDPFGDRNSVKRNSNKGILHEKYNSNSIANDIGLVKISQAVSFNNLIAPIKLPSSSDASKNYAGLSATISGWGKTHDWTDMTYNLMYTTLSLIDNKKGVEYFGDYVRSTNIVADGSYYATCEGDSGGALFMKENGKNKQIGIVSYGSSCGCECGYPDVFTKVASYVKWIENKTGLKL